VRRSIGITISKGGVELVSSNREFNKVANNPSTREFLKSPQWSFVLERRNLCKATVLAH
jgi:hypothetical protein